MTRRNSIINKDAHATDSVMFKPENFLLAFHPFTLTLSFSLPMGRENERVRAIFQRNIVK
jgi:hypothetical protein